jgi:hypothetical protein
MNKLKYFIFWIISIVTITAVMFFIYALAQQGLRQSANDPQIQMAEDAAAQLSAGKNPSEFNSQTKVDIATSLAPYLLIYDNQGQPLASTGALKGEVPNIPPGVLSVAQKFGQDRVTWQPEPGVRSAVVAVPFGNPVSGYVIAGKSLREIEIREDNLLTLTILVWLAGLLASLIILLIVLKIDSKYSIGA